MRIGVIADDFTGATDAASFIVKNGLSAVQFSGVPNQDISSSDDALIVSLKSRSNDPKKAVKDSLQACQWLRRQGCNLIYFKYCSTFDSTAQGNIGPVSEALMAELKVSSCVLCPSLPVNGRTVYQGNLFVFNTLLSESGMKDHPITPMTDSNVLRLIEKQSSGKAGLVNWATVSKGTSEVRSKIEELNEQNVRFIVCDAISESDLFTIGAEAQHHMLVTGGSGLVGAIANHVSQTTPTQESHIGKNAFVSVSGNGVVLSGSCSLMTNQQVANYKQLAPSFKLDVDQCINNKAYGKEVLTWVLQHKEHDYFPLVYATVEAKELQNIQTQYGSQASVAVERVFHELVKELYSHGFNSFVSAGGETSGTVTQALDVTGFRVGKEIAPGVPWVNSLDGEIMLALKSGNFGAPDFFEQAQEQLK
ncbi:3-oxo-tetronate kinase [Vibrio coralliirubri]|uniref:3-oxo-tetronate kinase n=1 Tax=Vibrio coralliirubri TaxID=1516159 RepID=UPI00069BECEC|nr:3-oxo-tetronate kinase [Vibrio coralliirubri]